MNKITQIEQNIEKLKIYGYSLQTDALIPSSIATGNIFDPNSDNIETIYKILIKIVHSFIQETYNMKKIKYFVNPGIKSYIFSSFYYLNNTKLVLIIPDINQPSGVTNKNSLFYDGVIPGSIFEFIKILTKENYCSLLINPYKKQYKNTEIGLDHYSHCKYAFKEYIEKKTDFIKDFIILSLGTISTISILKLISEGIFKNDLLKKTKKIILLDSKHEDFYKTISEESIQYWNQNVINYCLSEVPLGQIITSDVDNGCINRSIGTTDKNKSYQELSKEFVHYLKL